MVVLCCYCRVGSSSNRAHVGVVFLRLVLLCQILQKIEECLIDPIDSSIVVVVAVVCLYPFSSFSLLCPSYSA